MRNNPCKNCVPPKRHICCHASCKEYKDAKQANDAENDARRAVRWVEDNLIEMDTISMKHNRVIRYDRKW